MEAEEILDECKDIVEEVSKRYNYDDNLKTVLAKAIFSMLKDSNQEDRKLFYQMLSHTPIVITDNLTQEGYDKLLEQYIGKDVNQHIIEEDRDLGEYGKSISAGAYVSEPIFDENMNLQDKKSFVYIQRVAGKTKEFFGTDINVSHLIHELGHAWHAEKEQYIMQPDGTLIERVGTAEFTYSFSKTPDNKFVKQCTKSAGLMIEESMNTVAEENAMANYMGISLEELKKESKGVLVPSNYQGYMADFVRHMLENLGREDFENYRLYGDVKSRDRINTLMEKTDYWKNRETDILLSSDSPRSYGEKRAIVGRMTSVRVQEFFRDYETTYFPDISKMTPLEKIDNVLEQKYTMNMERFNMEHENYVSLVNMLSYEGYPLINQAADLKKEQELFSVVSDVKSSDLSSITHETKMMAEGTLEKGENANVEKD